MANVKISQLTAAAPLVGTEVIPIVQLGSTVKVTAQDIANLAVGIEGTNYVFVAANGTDVENAAELQSAYNLAKVKVDYQESVQPVNINNFYYENGFLQIYDYSLFAQNGGPIQDNVVYELLFDGVSYFAYTQFGGMMGWFWIDGIYPPGTGYTTLKILVNTITYNLVTVVVAPGKYSFASNFLVDAEYVSIVSLTGNVDVLFTGSGTINVTANDILLKGIDVQDKNFTIATNLDLLVIENCKGGDFSFGGDATYGSNPINVSGTFIDCEGGSYNFATYGIASGVFKRCKMTGFGGFGGGYNGIASGTFIDCDGGTGSCFSGQNGIASGIFTNCKGGNGSFSYSNGVAVGTFTNCIGGINSFGGDSSGVASGTFTNCIGGELSFGGGSGGILSGKLHYCRLTAGTFKTVTGGGRTYYCVDGNGNTNNQ